MGKLNNKNGISQGEEEYEKFGEWGEVKGGNTIRELDIADLVKQKLKDNPIKTTIVEKKKEEKIAVEKEINNSDAKYRKSFYLGFSIVRMLNDLKGKHPNVNVRISKIVESAIKYYYKYIMEEGGTQE